MFHLAMITTDRSVKGRHNYIFDTLSNMKRAGIFESDLVSSFRIIIDNSNEKYAHEIHSKVPHWIQVIPYPKRFGSAGTAYLAHYKLQESEHKDTDWFITMEDDLDFVSNFSSVLKGWMDENYDENRIVYMLGVWKEYANYFRKSDREYIDFFGHNKENHKSFSDTSPTKLLRGSQCYMMKPEHSEEFQIYLLKSLRESNNFLIHHDMRIRHWLNSIVKQTKRNELGLIRAPSPYSFVNHIGKESAVYDVKKHIDPEFIFKQEQP